MLWTASRPCRAYVLAIDAAAVGAFILTAALVPISSDHLIWFGALAVASVVHLELTLGIERLRELHTESNTYTNLKSIWTFAGLLVLPPPLVATLVALTYTHMWFRVSRRIVPHRWVFSASNVIIASTAGGAVLLTAFPNTYPSLPSGWVGFAVVVTAAAVRWIVNRALTSFAVVLMYPGNTLRGSFGPMSDNLIEYGSLALGILVANTLDDPAYLLALAIPVVVVHRGLMLHHFEHAAHRDRATGLHNAGFWHELAGKALARATHQRTKAGLLMVHLDNHRRITTRYGPDAADRALRLVADVLKAALRRDDLAGRLAGEDLVLLLNDVDATDLAAIAEQVRLAVRRIEVTLDRPSGPILINNLTVSIGGALFPDTARTLDELMLAADNAEIAAENRLGDQARFARPNVQAAANNPVWSPTDDPR